MIGDGLTLIIKKIYLAMKLNFIFLFCTLGGLVVFGIGPAIITTLEIYQYYEKEDIKYRLSDILKIFKKSFVQGNITAWLFVFIATLLVLNINLATQIKAMWALPLMLFIIMLLILVIPWIIITFHVLAMYETRISQGFKLSFYIYFSNFFVVLKLIILSVIIYYISSLYKGLYLFVTFGTLFLVTEKVLNKNISQIEVLVNGTNQN